MMATLDYGSSSPNDIRAQGWMVAVHNDYRQNGKLHTFWLFTKGSLCVKGEGTDDFAALDECHRVIAEFNRRNALMDIK